MYGAVLAWLSHHRFFIISSAYTESEREREREREGKRERKGRRDGQSLPT